MSRNLISKLTESAWNDCDRQAIYEGEDYYEYYINRTDFENKVYDIIKEVLDEYELAFAAKVGNHICDLDDNNTEKLTEEIMDECRKELGL